MELAEVTVEEVAFGLNPQRLPIWGAIRARASAADEDEDDSGLEAEGCPPVDGGGRLI